MIFVDDDIDNTAPDELRELLASLPSWRRHKALSYRATAGRIASAKAYNLLRKALKQNYGIITHEEFSYNSQGKPFLSETGNVYFSLSHCGGAVACSVNDSETGVDIETFRLPHRAMLEYCCEETEIEEIIASACPELTFTVLWTRKESLFKMLGTGITHDIKNILTTTPTDYTFHTLVNAARRYVVTECVRKI